MENEDPGALCYHSGHPEDDGEGTDDRVFEDSAFEFDGNDIEDAFGELFGPSPLLSPEPLPGPPNSGPGLGPQAASDLEPPPAPQEPSLEGPPNENHRMRVRVGKAWGPSAMFQLIEQHVGSSHGW